MGKKSNGKGRTKFESDRLLARRAECLRRWRAGETHAVIAEALGISRQLVTLDCQLALREWRAAHRGSINETAEFEWELLNWVQLEAQSQYELSQDPKQKKNRADSRFLDLVIKAGEHRRKLLGLDKPTKIEAQTTTELNFGTGFKKLVEMKAEVQKRMEMRKARKAESAK